jgi:hypothetical protein
LAAGNLAILASLLGVLFLAGEGYFHFLFDHPDGAMVLLSSRRWQERHVRQNQLGYRGPLPPSGAPLDPARPRIAILGDSYVVGQGIDDERDLVSAQVERLLRERGITASVYNVAGPGWDTRQEILNLDRLKSWGATFDAVVLVYVLNDHMSVNWLPRDYVAAVDRADNPPALIAPLLDRSFFASFLYHLSTTYRDPTLSRYDEMELVMYRRPDIREDHFRTLASLVTRVRSSGASLLVVTFPTAYPAWQEYRLAEVHPLLDSFWREMGVPHVDLLADLSALDPRDLVVWRFDTHPNARAHRVAAEAIAGRLETMLRPGGGPGPGAGIRRGAPGPAVLPPG